jgi:hypothetical protein
MAKPRSFARLMLNGWGVIGFFGLIFFMIFSTVSTLAGRTAERLTTEGVTVEATVTDKEVRRNSSGATKAQGYRLLYVFEVDGVRYEGRDGVPLEVFEGSEPGQNVAIRYWSFDPSVSGIEPVDAAVEARVTRNIALVGGIFALVGFFFSVSRARRQVNLRRYGDRRRAVVLAHEKSINKPNKVPRYRVLWRDEKGGEGRSIPYRRQYLPDEGDEIVVYVDPKTGSSEWEYVLFHLPRE